MKRRPRRIPEVLTPEERGRLLGELQAGWLEGFGSLSNLRNLAIIRLLLNTGLRARELRELKTSQIDWRTGRFKVRGKGGVERVLRISRTDLELLGCWLGRRGTSSNPASSNLLFTSLDGAQPLGDRWLRRMVKRVALQAGIQKDIHPHTLRHSFASNLLRQEKNIFLVSKALGHAGLDTTMIYLHIEDEILEDAMVRMAEGG